MKTTVLLSLITISSACADPIWHCSRTAETESATNQFSHTQMSEFSIASVNSTANVIGVSINDLIDIYSGIQVRIGGIPLSACFIATEDALTKTALSSLGLQPAVIQALSKKSSIVQSNLHLVSTNEQMLSCIEKNFPAVGYLDEPLETSSVHPCF